MQILVIGKDGKLGKQLFKHFEQSDIRVIGTTRKALEAQIHLDLNVGDFSQLPDGPGVAFICAGVTNLSEINSRVTDAYFINVYQTSRLIKFLLRKRWKVVYFSSDAVYQIPDFDSVYSGVYFDYALQKLSVEKAIKDNINVKIVRLSKIMFDDLEVISNFTKSQNISVRSNHYVSFVSISYVLDQIDFVLKSSKRLFSLRGESYFSYAEFLSQLQIRKIYSFSEMRVIRADPEDVFHHVDSVVDSEWLELHQDTESIFRFIENRIKNYPERLSRNI